MNWKSLVQTKSVERFKHLCARLDALAPRDRLALFGACLALVLAAEFLLVQPMHERRERIISAEREQVDREADETTRVEQLRRKKLDDLQSRLARLDRDLAQLGAGSGAGLSLSSLLAQALARQNVSIVALREMAVEEIARPSVDVTEAGTPAAPGTPAGADTPAAPGTTLFRHRFEMKLSGTPAALIDAVRALDQGARPLRIERVRMTGSGAGPIDVAVTLAVIGTEHSWLSI